jgi:hypothetical protein
MQLHDFVVEPDPDGGTLEASFSPDGQYVLSGIIWIAPQCVYINVCFF